MKILENFDFYRDLIKNEIIEKKIVYNSTTAADLFYEFRGHYYYGNYSIGLAPLYYKNEVQIALKYTDEKNLEYLRLKGNEVIDRLINIFYNITLKLEDKIDKILQNENLTIEKQEKQILRMIDKTNLVNQSLEPSPICYRNY